MKEVVFIIQNWRLGQTEKSVKTMIESLTDEWRKELHLLRKRSNFENKGRAIRKLSR
jgi:hypothetical protein